MLSYYYNVPCMLKFAICDSSFEFNFFY